MPWPILLRIQICLHVVSIMSDVKQGYSDWNISELLSLIEIGTWDWELDTGKVIYSEAWARMLGYTLADLAQTVATWERIVLPEDLPYANEQIEKHLSGNAPTYEAEFRMVCKDGSIIWAQDKGRVTQYDKDGKPIRFMGVIQNVSRLKNAELSLRENQETLDLAVSVAGLGTWDWDIPGNRVEYNDEYLRMLGYSQEDISGSIEEWESMNHPDDLPKSMKMLDEYIAGKISEYECEIRMKHRDGSYIWTRDVGRIVARDQDGNAIRIIGGHLNIDELKRSEKRLTEALEALENNKLYLESKIADRTKALVEQDKMLWTVNQISRMLLSFNSEENFDILVKDCLRMLGESINKSRVYIWKDRTDSQGKAYCTQIYEWVKGVEPIQGNEQYEEIPYENLPLFEEATNSGRCLNDLIKNLSPKEQAILLPQGIKTILIAPVAINSKRWGFIGVDNCDNEELFTAIQENMLFMSGSMLGNTIEKMETEAEIREMEQRTQLMLNATPLCCNLWNTQCQNMSCNDEAVRLFELSSQQEYLQRFNELSPEYQPCGRRSDELVREYLRKAFEKGYLHFEWMHKMVDGREIPAEVTLVRIRYKDSYIVAGYTRDLREQKAMLAQLHAKEDDLRTARDEAVLSSKAKSNFLANMSHEIRTPMNAISGFADIILRESQGEKSAEYANGIKNACNNLINIINDILDISKIESGKLEVVNSPYEMSSLLNDTITMCRMRLGDKPIMFVTDIDSRLPARLIGDEIRIKQVLINILSNAIKFTQDGHITLKVWGSVEGTRASLCFSVEDSGVGIKEDDLSRMFDEFERVNTTKNRSIEGTGLGLAISKQLCEMMGGTIDVESTYGRGSTFTIRLIQECPDYERMSRVISPKSVLLYEPRDMYRKSITATINNLDCTCVPCSNQSELYESLENADYDFLLSSSLYLEKMRSLVEKKCLKTSIAVFADYGENIYDDSVYTILSPINCLQMADMLNGRQSDGEYDQNYGGNFTAPTARVLVVDDNPVNLSVAIGLMVPYAFVVDTAVNGIQAVEMVKNNIYDLVFMDHMMPEMDGIDATVAIRHLDGEYYRSLPIIALTANALVGTREMFMREGMNDFIAKPIELNKLSHVLFKWLPDSKLIRDKVEEGKPENGRQPLEIPGINTKKGIASVGGDIGQYMHILSVYLMDGVKKLDSLTGYFKQQNLTAFRTEVHALKSATATIGGAELAAMAAKLEAAAQNEDFKFVNDNLQKFLFDFSNILAGIRPVVEDEMKKKKSRSDTVIKGDMSRLPQSLEALYQAAELADIVDIDRIMGELRGFSWPLKVEAGLTDIQAALDVFDYDGVLDVVIRLKGK